MVVVVPAKQLLINKQAVCALGLRCNRCRIFKMAAKVEKFPRLYALYFDRNSCFLRKLSTIT